MLASPIRPSKCVRSASSPCLSPFPTQSTIATSSLSFAALPPPPCAPPPPRPPAPPRSDASSLLDDHAVLLGGALAATVVIALGSLVWWRHRRYRVWHKQNVDDTTVAFGSLQSDADSFDQNAMLPLPDVYEQMRNKLEGARGHSQVEALEALPASSSASVRGRERDREMEGPPSPDEYHHQDSPNQRAARYAPGPSFLLGELSPEARQSLIQSSARSKPLATGRGGSLVMTGAAVEITQRGNQQHSDASPESRNDVVTLQGTGIGHEPSMQFCMHPFRQETMATATRGLDAGAARARQNGARWAFIHCPITAHGLTGIDEHFRLGGATAESAHFESGYPT
ncbi:hypothetical protein CYMTET_52156 [Cymbomonas tetramitiformis]|uniref:Uncharacterized protein n=1 Tax=Cymbomonas tetramitiformis TaxID=36881 RepID=A0AAE0BLE5_9CHLO|nr:hypothetical protein CYMTET_52156 [Cymbomonas tetramitiformis]